MKTLKRLVASLALSFLAALSIGLGSSTHESYEVKKGFVFGSPHAQQAMPSAGIYSVKRWGFPATYREVESFRSTESNPMELAYVSKSFSPLLVVTNVVLLMSFLVAILSPVTIFWRPKKQLATDVDVEPQTKSTEQQQVSPVNEHANTRH